MLEFKDVSFKYASDDFSMMNNLSFTVNDGEFISIIGKSGCGKSTVFRLINGLEKPQNGEIFVDGKNIKDIKNYSAYMPQKDLLFPWRTIEKNICLAPEIQKADKKETKTKAEEILKEVGLWDYKNKYPRDLSGGMRQRASFARTLLSGGNLMLLDEPFSALDYQTRLDVCDEISGIIKNEGKTAIMVTHDISEAISVSDRVIVFSKVPAVIKNEYKIEMPYGKGRRDNPLFRQYFNSIWKELKQQ